METLDLSSKKIQDAAKKLDNAMEQKDTESAISCFSDDCEIDLLSVHLKGKQGVRKWLAWLYEDLLNIKFEPITIMTDRNTFFEEYIIHSTLMDGKQVQSKQAEVLIYDATYKVKSLRVYFDRLDFADVVAHNFISRGVVKEIIDISVKGLT